MRNPFQHMLVCVFAWSASGVLMGCQAGGNKSEKAGVSMAGVDHLAEHLSVQDYWVDGRAGFQAGRGGRVVCCARIPVKWSATAAVEVHWEVANWRDGTWSCFRRRVPLAPYEELGNLYVHFLPDGDVKAVVSNYVPWSQVYSGPKVPITKKEPWDKYPAPPVTSDCPENEHEKP